MCSACSRSMFKVERVAIDQNGNPAFVADHFGGRGKGHRRDQDAIARAQTERVHGQVQRSGAGVHRDGMGRRHRRGKLLLEPLDSRAGRQPSGAQGVNDLVDF